MRGKQESRTGKTPVPQAFRPASSTPRAGYPGAARTRMQGAEFFRALVENAAQAVMVILPDGSIQYHNTAAEALLTCSSRDVYATNFFAFLHPDDVPGLQAILQQKTCCSESSPVTTVQVRLQNRNRLWKTAAIHLANRVDDPFVRGWILNMTDVTERVRSEQELQENRQHLRSLAAALTMTEERERHALATQLHDSIGQTLALLNLKLGELETGDPPPDFSRRIAEARALVGEMTKVTRTLTFALSPPILYALGLEAAVDAMGKRLAEQYGIAFACYEFGPPQPLNEELRILLFQSIRELLLNVVKHARARQAKVSFSRGSETFSVVVEDDGIGFDTASLFRRNHAVAGFGLFSIRERLKHLDGSFTMHSVPGQGTMATLSVPLPARFSKASPVRSEEVRPHVHPYSPGR